MLAVTDTFAQYLSTELQLTSALHQLLEQELAALSTNQLKPLAQIQQQKSILLEQLQQQADKRLQWMTHHNYPHTSKCIKRPEFADHETIPELWQQLGQSYESNQHLSAVLSELVLKLRKRTMDQMNILRGKQNDPHLYNANGKSSGLNKGSGYTCA